MLFFVGGAARTGKGILARRLLAELGLPYLSLDVLKMGLVRGVPELAIDPNVGSLAVAERLWPLVREMSVSLLYDRVDYVFEGELLPKDVAALRQSYPSQVIASFLGYGTITPADKLREVRTFGGHPNDWAADYDDSDLLPIISREIAFSHHLRAECAQFGFRYFDTSHEFTMTLDDAFAFLGKHVRPCKRASG